ncbi:LON peptidase substrate-binding domain-containing protein [Pseudoalteromonas ruthenica]|uniref:LON peptidase substrate-binding domain-containing protein n=1 Tax=Pseudoalteromonas ruthenica TaxID=151081 RepID=UPI00241E1C0C|nr:LON peptidase substrate-binding domain-containing protein [Pseudoalteromonas ruthenica]|tara:strand:+ start:100497 stop:101060 length:564 start_codon:yes stop_codon:yes gene_type:complete
MKYAVFPLPLVLLPQGVTKLKIFEQRYIHMVKECLREQRGFVITPLAKENDDQTSEFGCLVKIIDFDQDPTGQLLITVQGESLMRIDNITYLDNGLRYCTHPTEIETATVPEVELTDLAKALKWVLDNNPELKCLYDCPNYDDAKWVAYRWLEILPVDYNQKKLIIRDHNFEQLLDFLHTVINFNER